MAINWYQMARRALTNVGLVFGKAAGSNPNVNDKHANACDALCQLIKILAEKTLAEITANNYDLVSASTLALNLSQALEDLGH